MLPTIENASHPPTGIALYNYLGQEEFEDTKGVIGIRKSKKNRQQNGQARKHKQRSAKHTHKTKDRVTQTPLKTRSDIVKCLRYNLISNECHSIQWCVLMGHVVSMTHIGN